MHPPPRLRRSGPTRRPAHRPGLALVWLLLLGGACAQPVPQAAAVRADAAARPPAAAQEAVHAAGADPAGLTPELVGLGPEQAASALRAAGAGGKLVAFVDDAPVSVQHPPPDAPLPPDRIVLVWFGAPPEPAPPRPADQAPVRPPPPPSTAPSTAPPAAVPAASAPPPPPAQAPAVADSPPPALPAVAVLEGPASWYGPGFAGNRTACGSTFDPAQLTLASRELACGTRVRITGPGGSVEAIVSDWGPAEWTGRRFDLSAAAFAAIADPGAGVVPVRIEVRS